MPHLQSWPDSKHSPRIVDYTHYCLQTMQKNHISLLALELYLFLFRRCEKYVQFRDAMVMMVLLKTPNMEYIVMNGQLEERPKAYLKKKGHFGST